MNFKSYLEKQFEFGQKNGKVELIIDGQIVSNDISTYEDTATLKNIAAVAVNKLVQKVNELPDTDVNKKEFLMVTNQLQTNLAQGYFVGILSDLFGVLENRIDFNSTTNDINIDGILYGKKLKVLSDALNAKAAPKPLDPEKVKKWARK